jgi:hypothetical protein
MYVCVLRNKPTELERSYNYVYHPVYSITYHYYQSFMRPPCVRQVCFYEERWVVNCRRLVDVGVLGYRLHSSEPVKGLDIAPGS